MTRLQRLVAGLEDLGCGAAILVGADHAVHLAAYSRLYSGPVALVVTSDGERTLVTPAYEVETARRRADVDRVVGYGEPHFGLDPQPERALADALVAQAPAGAVAVDDGSGLAQEALMRAGRRVRALGSLVARIRLTKDADEQVALTRAFRLALTAQASVGRGAVPGAREIDLYAAAQAAAQVEAGTPIDFGGDLLTGVRGALVCGPVAVAGPTRARAGDAIVSDLSVRLGGYWGDSARTYLVGEPESELLAAREHVTRVLDETATLLRPGAVAEELFESMRAELVGRFPQGSFPHHGGHGVGVTPLEAPHLIPGDRTPLQEGMVLAVEPGIYVQGRFGVRVENMYLVTVHGGTELGALA